MLSSIRVFAQSWAARGLFVLLIISFVVFGIGNRDLLHPKISNSVITAGARSIGPAGMKMVGRFIANAPMMRAGVVLSQPPISTQPSAG